MKKTLFILKKRSIYSDGAYSNVDSGLFNSAKLVNDMLVKNGVNSKIVQVDDNNGIDRECFLFKPDIVIIEALWVVPSKFEILHKLHPNVTWVIRLHSELPFIANEGVAMEWIQEYVKYENVVLSSNSKYMCESLKDLLGVNIIYSPNYYPVNLDFTIEKKKITNKIKVGLFGAIRPLKNSLTQAVAAINYANKNELTLELHINSARVEQKGENVLKNLKVLFKDSNHKLIEHGWLPHGEFIELIKQMDICLQVSLTETYNIVAADSVNSNVPIVTSKEITFINPIGKVYSNKDTRKIESKIDDNLSFRYLTVILNKLLLNWDAYKAKKIWLNWLK
jgi:hypothetical protein